MTKSEGKIIIAPGLNIWPHERTTAESLAEAGYIVEFVKKSEIDYEKSADVFLDGVLWEFKAPRASNTKAIERNLRRGLEQSPCIAFDRRRMKGIPDSAVERELRICAETRIKKLHHVIFINRHGDVIDIK